MRRKTMSVTLGAMCAAITLIIVLLDRITTGLLMTFIPIPLMLYGLYFSYKDSLITYIASILLVMMVSGNVAMWLLTATYGFVGMAYILAKKQNKTKKIRFLYVFLANALNYIVMISLFGAFFQMDYMDTLTTIRNFLNMSNENVVKILFYLLAFVTILLETYVVILTTDLIMALMNRHRK